MRLFLYTYKSPENYSRSMVLGVFGAPHDSAGLPGKVKKLRPGDVVLIRDGSRHGLGLLGLCEVTGRVFDQTTDSPFKDRLWPDEFREEQMIYRFRVSVRFDTYQAPRLRDARWADLDALSIIGSKGRPLKGRQAWAKKFCGNYISSESELRAFSDLLGLAAEQPGR